MWGRPRPLGSALEGTFLDTTGPPPSRNEEQPGAAFLA